LGQSNGHGYAYSVRCDLTCNAMDSDGVQNVSEGKSKLTLLAGPKKSECREWTKILLLLRDDPRYDFGFRSHRE
jgi:hypothetical protein